MRVIPGRLCLLAIIGSVAVLLGSTRAGTAAAEPALTPPVYDSAFWQHWGDGQAELAGYDLTFPRYGKTRRGTAVTIFVTEPFSNSARVKADPGKHPDADVFPVMKLNYVQDFPTGIYDYNIMTSTFVALRSVNGRPAGTPAKVSFSSQEWCGHVYQQMRFDGDSIRHELHSYFDSEADQDRRLDYPADGVAEDVLPFWARGMAAPVLRPGESRTVRLLRSLERARLGHRPVAWQQAELMRSVQPQTVTIPAGTFETDVYTVAVEPPDAGLRSVTFYVEQAWPRRLVKWETTEGFRAELLASTRLKYWQMNGPGFESALKELGLSPRPARTP